MHLVFCLFLSMQLLSAAFPQKQQEPVFYFNQVFTLNQFNQVTLVDSTGKEASKLQFQLGNILDSRCPSDVQCIQAGSAEVNITLAVPDGESATITLGVGGNRIIKQQAARTNNLTVGNASYTITVLDVMPYPTATGIQLVKHARIIVAKL